MGAETGTRALRVYTRTFGGGNGGLKGFLCSVLWLGISAIVIALTMDRVAYAKLGRDAFGDRYTD